MSKIYTIDYDLTKPGQNYHKLVQALETLNAKRMMLSKWALVSTATAEDIGHHLRQYIDSTDRLFVAELSGDWWGVNLMLKLNDVRNAAMSAAYR